GGSIPRSEPERPKEEIIPKPTWAHPASLVTLDNLRLIASPWGGNNAFECLPYQLSMVLPVPTMVTMS
uniref:Uncharacterized protein n=1 Tax=Chelonoidis abingdonii TaxID=106734 RepID=A0A8C0H2S3_CHEAB